MIHIQPIIRTVSQEMKRTTRRPDDATAVELVDGVGREEDERPDERAAGEREILLDAEEAVELHAEELDGDDLGDDGRGHDDAGQDDEQRRVALLKRKAVVRRTQRGIGAVGHRSSLP
jgi:hypothetical protein